MIRLTLRGRSSYIVPAVVLASLVCLAPSCNDPSAPPDASFIQEGMENLIEFVDSPRYA